MDDIKVEDVLWDIDRHLKSLISVDHIFLMATLEKSVERFNVLSKHIKPWNKRKFETTDSSMYSALLWLTANEASKMVKPEQYQYHKYITMLNKMLHGIDVPHDVLMPEIFYWPHTQGIVIARKVELKDHLVMYQGTTIGRVGDRYPEFIGPLIMYPYSSITGNSFIGDHVILSAHEKVHGFDHEEDPIRKRYDLFEFHFNGDFI